MIFRYVVASLMTKKKIEEILFTCKNCITSSVCVLIWTLKDDGMEYVISKVFILFTSTFPLIGPIDYCLDE